MTSRKKVRRAQRHTLGLLAEAEQALRDGERALALKLVRRALDAGFMNARVHVDAAVLLRQLGHDGDAGWAAQRAVDLAPRAAFVRQRLQQAGIGVAAEERASAGDAAPAPADLAPPPRTERSRGFIAGEAWGALGRQGAAVAAGWLTADEQRSLADLDTASAAFRAERAIAAPRGSLHWAAFGPAAPPWFASALAELYACAAELANELQARLGAAARFPPACPPPAAHVDRAARLVLRGGAVWPERADLGDRATFPLRGCLALGPAALAVVIVDRRPGKRRERRCAVPPGAAAWFAARDRPVVVGGVLGLQPVAWELRADGDTAAVLIDWNDVVAG